MTTEYLSEKLRLEVDRAKIEKGGENLYFHLRELFSLLERHLTASNREVNNIIISGGVGGTFVYGAPDELGEYADGVWRNETDSLGYSIEQYQSGTWTALASLNSNGDFTLTNLADGLVTATSGELGSITDGPAALGTAYSHSQVSPGNPHGVSKSDVGLGSVENTALSTWAGTTNITTLGTITSGTWNGTALVADYVPNAQALNGFNENAIALLSSTSAVDMQTVGSTTLYTIPTGKVGRITHVAVRDPSASMAGGTDFDFTQWRQTVNLSSLTTADTDYIILDGNNAKYQELAAGTNFQITVNTGTTAACTATIDVFGYLT